LKPLAKSISESANFLKLLKREHDAKREFKDQSESHTPYFQFLLL